MIRPLVTAEQIGTFTADIPAADDPNISPHPADVTITRQEGWRETVAVVCGGLNPRELTEARARLMAAAPELLAACDLALWLLRRVEGWDQADGAEPITKFAATRHAEQIEAAIARARGA
jgi:hypothetical protein